MDDNGDLVFQQGDRNNLMSSSSGMYTNIQDEKVLEEKTMNTMSMLKSSSGEDSLFFHTGWDPLVSMVQNLEFKGSSLDSHHQISPSSLNVGILEDPRMNDSSHSIQYPADPRHGEIEPKVSCFGNGSFSEMLSPFCLPESNQTRNAGSLPPRTITDPGVIFQEDLPIRNGDYRRTVLNGKKRKGAPELHETHSQFDSVQSIETEHRRDGPGEAIEGLKGLDERKKRNKQTPSSNLCGKLTSKQTKDSSQTGEPPKEDYVHVRARRGQATNSHSLAERVRREKISERMRLLQDLVPGCDKITGKALMLDEIINYVQSLQRQVEFLSMKLATVNPELNIDIERILSKDILHSHGEGGGLSVHGFHPGMNSSHSQFHLYPRETIQTIQNTELHSLPMPQITKSWDDDLHSVVQTGFVSNPALNDIGLNGCTKVQI